MLMFCLVGLFASVCGLWGCFDCGIVWFVIVCWVFVFVICVNLKLFGAIVLDASYWLVYLLIMQFDWLVFGFAIAGCLTFD